MPAQMIKTQTQSSYIDEFLPMTNTNTPQQKETDNKPTVLLLEDDRTMRRLVRASLGDQCELLFASSAQLGTKLYKSERPDISFIDINLPDQNGYEFLDWLLKTDPEAHAVMFSGQVNNNNIHRSIENGAKGFISKPFDPQKMMFFISRLFK